jgi:site-specific DNA-methyltransferase (adenine-specific)
VSKGVDDAGTISRFFAQFRYEPQDIEPLIYCPKVARSERNRGCDEMEQKTPDILTGRKPASPGLVMPDGKANPYAGTTGETPRGNGHPTVKPVTLLRYLSRLITPQGGTLLDPFAGSGSTLVAAHREGFDCIGMEREAEYVKIIRARTADVQDRVGLFADDGQ